MDKEVNYKDVLADFIDLERLKKLILIIGCVAIVLLVIDTSIMSVSISNLVTDLNTNATGIQFAIALYGLVTGSLMLLGGKLQDILGRKKTLMYGIILFVIGAFITVISLNLVMLVIGWSIIEGIAAAFMIPTIIAFISEWFAGKERLEALAIFGGVSAVAAASGPIVGGTLATYLSWRVAFTIMVVIGIILFFYSRKLVETEITATWRDIDILGVLSVTSGLFILLVGLVLLETPETRSLAFWLIGISIIFLIVFYLLQKRRIKLFKQPLIDIRLFKIKNFVLGNISRFVSNLVFTGGLVFVFPIFLQQVMGLNAFMTGVALFPATMGALILALLTPKLSEYIKTRYLLILSFLVQLVGIYFLINTFSLDTTIMDLVGGVFLVGAGYGVTSAILPDTIMSSAPRDRQNDAAAVAETFSRIGSSIGTAVFGTLLFFSVSSALLKSLNISGLLNQGITQAEVFSNIEAMQTTKLPLPQEIEQQVVKIINDIISSSMNDIMYAAAILFLIGIVIVFFIRENEVK